MTSQARSSRGVWKPVALLALALSGFSAAAEVPAQAQAAMVFRILPYDRNLAARSGSEIRMAVVYKEGDPDSVAAQKAIVDAVNRFAAKSKAGGLSVRAVPLAYTTPARLGDDLRAQSLSAVYVCPGLTGSVSAIVQATRARHALSFTGSEEYVRAGLSVGVILRGTRPAILVNLTASKSEGADLDSAFLDLAEVIR